MARKLTTNQINATITLLIAGLSTREIAKLTNVTYQTVTNIKDRNLALIEKTKKDMQKQAIQTSVMSNVDKIKKLTDMCLHRALQGIKHITPQKLKKESTAQLSITIGTLIDKYQLLNGNATSIQDHRFGSRAEADAYLNGSKTANIPLKVIEPKQLESAKVVKASQPIDKTPSNLEEKRLILKL